MEQNSPRDNPDDPRNGFFRSLPRKVVEIKASFGALIADPRSSRMRDELRRRLHALYTLARSYQLPKLTEALRACVDALDAARTAPSLSRPQIDLLAQHIASFNACAESDTQGVSNGDLPSGTRDDPNRAPTVRMSPVPAPPPLRVKVTLPDFGAPAGAEGKIPSPVPYRTLPPGTMLRKGPAAMSGLGAAIHVLFVGSSSRANSLHEALPPEVELLVTRTAADAVSRARDVAPDVIVAEAGGHADGVSLVASLRADPLTDFFPVVLVATGSETAEALRERCPEAVEVLPESLDGAGLWDALERVLGGGVAPLLASSYDFGDVTLDELTRALQDELRRGIVGAASPRARGARIALGAGNEVLAATWEAIARIREVVEQRTHGSVRFDVPAAPRGLPGTQVFTLGNDDAPAEAVDAPGDDPLPGRRVLLVDDDPAVVSTFAGLLREAGAEVTECTDGIEALQTARRMRPDLVIADIVMPGIDGFALCRAIRRDVALRHTPVILLSWKDDLIVRMRELGAQAQGYLRKESRGDAILARVRDAVRLRVRLLKRVAELTGTAEVRGRLERVGLFPLLETAGASLRDATVTISDQSSVTELHLREGALVSALRTAHDGSLLRGEAALMPVLGASTARFIVVRSKATVRENLGGDLAELLTRCARRIAALEDSLVGTGLLDVVRVEFDRDAAHAYARALPGPLRAVVERVVDGEAPRDLVLRDGMSPSDIEPMLVELARRGAVHKILGARGEDLAAMRLSAPESAVPPPTAENLVPAPTQLSPRPEAMRAGPPPPLPKRSTPPPAPPGPPSDGPAVTVEAPDAKSDAKSDVSLADAVWRELRDSVVEDVRKRRPSGTHAVVSAATPVRQEPAPDAIPELPALSELLVPVYAVSAVKTPATPTPAKLLAETVPPERVASRAEPVGPAGAEAARPPPDDEDHAALDVDDTTHTRELSQEMISELTDPLKELARNTAPPAVRPFDLVTEPEELSAPAIEVPDTGEVPKASRPPTPSARGAAASDGGEAVRSKVPPAPPPEALRSSRPPGQSGAYKMPALAPPQPPLQPKEQPRAQSKPAPRGATASTPRAAATHAEPAPSARRSMLLLVGVMAAFALSYYGVRWYLSHAEVPPEPAAGDGGEALGPAPAPTADEAAPEAPAVDDVPAALAADAAAPVGAPPVDAAAAQVERPDVGLGEYRDPTPWLDGAPLPPRSGVLVVTAPANAEGAEVQVDQRPAAGLPAHVVLSEGLHTLRFRVGTSVRYQFATVQAGRAVVIDPPPSR